MTCKSCDVGNESNWHCAFADGLTGVACRHRKHGEEHDCLRFVHNCPRRSSLVQLGEIVAVWRGLYGYNKSGGDSTGFNNGG